MVPDPDLLSGGVNLYTSFTKVNNKAPRLSDNDSLTPKSGCENKHHPSGLP
jgi:hypothetical protein